VRAWIVAALAIGCVPEAEAPRAVMPFFVHADVVFVNEMSSSFELQQVAMTVDGQPLPFGAATLKGGSHDVNVEADYRGNGYGVFAYLKQYRFKARLRYRLELPDARPRRIRCVGFEKGGPTTPLEERPQIRCETSVL
jgi:hypothetical protein